MNAEEITKQSLKKLDIKSIALNRDKFGALTFDKSYSLLEELRNLFVELQELDYERFLLPEEIQQINQRENLFLELLKQLAQFDPSTDTTFGKVVHDNFENQVESFYQETQRYIRNPLTYLRQEVARKSKDEKVLEEERRAVIQARKQSEELLEKLKIEYEKLQKEKAIIETAHGEVAAKYLAIHFSKQAKEYEDEAEKWLSRRNKLYWLLIAIVGANFLAYLLFFILYKVWNIGLPPREIFTIEYGLVKLALLAVLSYGISFASKNYNVNSHLSAINKHRRNVAQTLEDFLATNPDRKTEMLRQGTEAMFRHVSIGYIRREEQKDSGPVYEFINKFLPNKES